MIAGGAKIAVAGEYAAEFDPADNFVTLKDSNTRQFLVRSPQKNPQEEVKTGFFE